MKRSVSWWTAGLAIAGCTAGLTGCALGGSGGGDSGAVRSFTSFQTCLLTGSQGVAAGPAALVWSGMGDASQHTRALASYLAVAGPATPSAAVPFLGSLLARGCDVIVAEGAPEEAAVLAEAAKSRRVRFLLAGPGTTGPTAAGGNVAVVRGAGSGLRAAVAAAVEADTSS